MKLLVAALPDFVGVVLLVSHVRNSAENPISALCPTLARPFECQLPQATEHVPRNAVNPTSRPRTMEWKLKIILTGK